MAGNYKGLDPEDDLLAMERSAFRTHIGPEQASVLLLMWATQETADNNAFMREFAPWMNDIEEEEEL